jgi:uncharacterized protein YuzE
MKTTRYFDEQVLRKRPYLRREWCARIIVRPIRRERQPDGRIRRWGYVDELGGWALRVITLADGITVHNVSRPRLRGGADVKLHYYPETDSLYVEFQERPSVDTREITVDVRLDLDAEGRPVGLDIDHASRVLDLDHPGNQGPAAPAGGPGSRFRFGLMRGTMAEMPKGARPDPGRESACPGRSRRRSGAKWVMCPSNSRRKRREMGNVSL